MATILPTGTCFDDALEFLAELARTHPDHARLHLAHGLARSETGRSYAHAWVEHVGLCWEAGLLNGDQIFYAVPQREYYAAKRIGTVTRYSVNQAWEHNRRTGHFGPWHLDYIGFCNPEGNVDRVVGAAQVRPVAMMRVEK